MDVIEMPLLAADQTPEEAIDRMIEMNSGVASVRDSSGGFRLIRNVDVLRGWQLGTPTLADLHVGEFIDPLPEIRGGPQILQNVAERDNLQQALNQAATNYGIAEDSELLGSTRLSVWIATRHEILIHSPQKLWRCKNPNPHSGTIPPDVCVPICWCGYAVKCT
jgi:hypothetical protein